MEYITIKRARFNGMSGPVNLPYGTKVHCVNGVLYSDFALCSDHSQNAYDFFSRNDDGNGLDRGKLAQAIRKTLEKRDTDHQTRWDKVWRDRICQKYKRPEHVDYWLWNHDFFNANITDLRYIASLVGIKL